MKKTNKKVILFSLLISSIKIIAVDYKEYTRGNISTNNLVPYQVPNELGTYYTCFWNAVASYTPGNARNDAINTCNSSMVDYFTQTKTTDQDSYNKAVAHSNCSTTQQIGFVGDWGMTQKTGWNDPCYQQPQQQQQQQQADPSRYPSQYSQLLDEPSAQLAMGYLLEQIPNTLSDYANNYYSPEQVANFQQLYSEAAQRKAAFEQQQQQQQQQADIELQQLLSSY